LEAILIDCFFNSIYCFSIFVAHNSIVNCFN